MFLVVLLVVLLVGVIIKFFWWIAGAAALVGAFFAARAVTRTIERKRIQAAARDAELTRRADLQHRWTLRGDSRGVYGPEGAKTMRSVVPTPEVSGVDELSEQQAVATVAYTASDLRTLLSEKKPCWRWAAFASVLVQRRAEVHGRLRDSALGFVGATTTRLRTGLDIRCFVTTRLEELATLVSQVESFMLTPAFVDVFGEPDDEATADGDGIVHGGDVLARGVRPRRHRPGGHRVASRPKELQISCASAARMQSILRQCSQFRRSDVEATAKGLEPQTLKLFQVCKH